MIKNAACYIQIVARRGQRGGGRLQRRFREVVIRALLVGSAASLVLQPGGCLSWSCNLIGNRADVVAFVVVVLPPTPLSCPAACCHELYLFVRLVISPCRIGVQEIAAHGRARSIRKWGPGMGGKEENGVLIALVANIPAKAFRFSIQNHRPTKGSAGIALSLN